MTAEEQMEDTLSREVLETTPNYPGGVKPKRVINKESYKSNPQTWRPTYEDVERINSICEETGMSKTAVMRRGIYMFYRSVQARKRNLNKELSGGKLTNEV